MKPDPGRVTARRLNRAEYTNTIRDLLAVDFRADRNFPTDDSGEGFDNIGDVLTVSPMLMEKYLSAAGRIAERAIATGTLPKPVEVEYSLRFKNLRRIDPSNVEATHRFDFDADYELKVGLPGQRAKDAAPVTLGLWVDGKLTHTMPVETKPSGLVYFNPFSEERIRVPIPEGDHTLRLGFIDDPFVKGIAKEEIYKDTVNKWIGAVTVVGPFRSAGEKPSRKRILVCDPATGPPLRRSDPDHAGAARVSAAGDRRGGGGAAAVRGAGEARRARPWSRDWPWRSRRCSSRRISCFTSSAISTRTIPAGCTGSRTWSWRRG